MRPAPGGRHPAEQGPHGRDLRGRFEQTEHPGTPDTGHRLDEGRGPGRRPLERARRVAHVGGVRARGARAEAGHEPVDGARSQRDGRWTPRRGAAGARARRRAARRRRGLPGAARALRRGRHRAGAARAAGRALHGRGGARLGAVHGQGALQGADGGRAGVPQVEYAVARRGGRPRRSSTAAACRCSSSRRGSARRWGSRRWSRGGAGPRRSSTPSSTTRWCWSSAWSSGMEVECSVLGNGRPDRLAAGRDRAAPPTGTTTRPSTRSAAWS